MAVLKNGGDVKFNISFGNVDDAEKLARANKITKIIFGMLALAEKAGKELKIDALKGSAGKKA